MISKILLTEQEKELIVFEKSTGMTAHFSGKELSMVQEYCVDGKRSPFIDRLYDLGIFVSDDIKLRQQLLDKIVSTKLDLALTAIHVELTDTCPLKCPQCYNHDNISQTHIPLDSLKSIIDEAVSLNCFQMAFGGGEPLIYPYLLEAVEYVADTQMSVSITTSGYNASHQYVNDLIDKGINHFQVSLNSSVEKINNVTRDGYIYAINMMKILKNTDISWGVNLVLCKSSLATLCETVEFAKNMGANNVNILRYKPNNISDMYQNALSENEFYLACAQIKKLPKGIKVKLDSANSHMISYINNGNVNCVSCGCGAYLNFISVGADGSYKPCSHMSHDRACKYSSSSNILGYLHSGVTVATPAVCVGCKYVDICRGCIAIYDKVGDVPCPAFTDKE